MLYDLNEILRAFMKISQRFIISQIYYIQDSKSFAIERIEGGLERNLRRVPKSRRGSSDHRGVRRVREDEVGGEERETRIGRREARRRRDGGGYMKKG